MMPGSRPRAAAHAETAQYLFLSYDNYEEPGFTAPSM